MPLNLQTNSPLEGQLQAFENYYSEMQKWKFFLTFALTVLVRVSAKKLYPSVLRAFNTALKNDVGLSLWLIETLSHPEMIAEYIILCPISSSRYFVVSLLRAAFTCIYKHEEISILKYILNPKLLKNEIEENGNVDILETFWKINYETYYMGDYILPYAIVLLNNLIALLPLALSKQKSINQYLYLLYCLCKTHPQIKKYFLQNNLVGILLEVLLDAHGEFIDQKKELIILTKNPSIGFQKKAEQKDAKIEQKIEIISNPCKQYKFHLCLLSKVNI